MAQFYTLEEAARVLGMSAEELKSKAQHREIRAFLDGGSWRFRVVDIDELARHRGLGSDAELRLSDLEVPAAADPEKIEDLDLSEFQLGTAKPDLAEETMDIAAYAGGKTDDKPTPEMGSDHDLLFDDLSVPPNPVTGSSSVIIGMKSMGKLPSDSDVRLVPDNVKGSSDSDVRLASPDPDLRHPSDSDVTLIKDDTADHGFLRPSGSGSNDTAIRQSPVVGSSAEVPAAESDSDFELNPSSDIVDVLKPEPESGSDFELSALDASDEFESTPLKPSDSDVTAADPNLSGINLSRPSDSGINLQSAGSFDLGHHDSIELAPLSDDELKSFRPEASKAAAKPAKAEPSKAKQSLSATPPPSVKKGEKDIFDDTDFEVDVPSIGDDESSDDRTMQLEAASDFDIEDSDSGSEVFAIDEEDVDQNAGTVLAPSAIASDDDDEDDGFEEAVSSEMATAWSSDEGTSSGPAPAMVISREAAPEWGGLWVGLLCFTTLCILLASFVAWDLMRNLHDFHEMHNGSGLIQAIAGLFGK
ncbi:helix-turn-helix domain-containing protein [Aquisphaera insulae]|uniref:helix-turn-helix domain-containing protein n=1 Tax=Aquisphaera insulae TaxID=2712864 RepID=UPI0013ECB52E|nr:helix-turn-helix domain-containing protein [Aquisphaera insulae]